ncbi:hypothetical protein [Sneathiella chinensis]|uniref:Uncharacterized protein n=1 Tax=Sneathiella chinensis TaxID=349750 RepID=A0ABQ5TYU1_9PROT|nr:hypothetical protein [Sneathiella chinensis]GLQ05025.1 hypothetical protein GCM10007924_02460 [Sneathiella chinensis]
MPETRVIVATDHVLQKVGLALQDTADPNRMLSILLPPEETLRLMGTLLNAMENLELGPDDASVKAFLLKLVAAMDKRNRIGDGIDPFPADDPGQVPPPLQP